MHCSLTGRHASGWRRFGRRRRREDVFRDRSGSEGRRPLRLHLAAAAAHPAAPRPIVF